MISITATLIHSVTTRNEYVGTVFYRTHSGLVEVPSIPQDTTEIYLEHNRITELRNGTFSRLTQCTNLNIYSNVIETIEENAFNGMARLERLLLYANKLKFLQHSMFNGITSLTYLHVEYNSIETIQDAYFRNLFKLHTLRLGRNKLSGHIRKNVAGFKCSEGTVFT